MTSSIKPWEEIFGWFNYPFLYETAVRECPENSVFVEVGCFMGKSTSCMALYIKESGKNISFYAIDHWEGSEEHQEHYSDKNLWEIFEENMVKYELTKYIIPIKKTSVDASKLFPDESIDFLHLDASHDYDNVIEDIKSWAPKIKKNGIMTGDDFDIKYWPGVVRAVVDSFEGQNIRLINKPNETGNIWVYYK
jgi:predicted O-methyltransferase YrrM